MIVVYNHVATYIDDPIYQANTTQPMQRGVWLGGVSGTPTVFFDGNRQQGGNYASWPSNLDGYMQSARSYTIVPSLSVTQDSVVLLYTVVRTSGDASPTLYGVLVEDINYTGRNGVSNHDGSMRALFTPAQGNALAFNSEGVATGRVSLARQQIWNEKKLRVVVSVQDPATKKSLQAAQASALIATTIDDDDAALIGPATLDIVSVTGNVVLHRDNVTLHDDVHLAEHLATLVSGAYVIRLTSGASTSVRKVIVAN